MNEKHLDPAEALATEHARTIWWARHLTVHNRDPRLRGKKATARTFTFPALLIAASPCMMRSPQTRSRAGTSFSSQLRR